MKLRWSVCEDDSVAAVALDRLIVSLTPKLVLSPVPWYEDVNVLFKLMVVDDPIVWVLVVDQPFVPDTDSTPTFALRNKGPNGHKRRGSWRG